MVGLLNGDFDVDVLFAMWLQTARDENYPWTPAKVIKEIESSAGFRDYGWAEFLGEFLDRPSCCMDLRISYIRSRPDFSAFQPVTLKASNCLWHPYVRAASFGIIKLAKLR